MSGADSESGREEAGRGGKRREEEGKGRRTRRKRRDEKRRDVEKKEEGREDEKGRDEEKGREETRREEKRLGTVHTVQYCIKHILYFSTLYFRLKPRRQPLASSQSHPPSCPTLPARPPPCARPATAAATESPTRSLACCTLQGCSKWEVRRQRQGRPLPLPLRRGRGPGRGRGRSPCPEP